MSCNNGKLKQLTSFLGAFPIIKKLFNDKNTNNPFFVVSKDGFNIDKVYDRENIMDENGEFRPEFLNDLSHNVDDNKEMIRAIQSLGNPVQKDGYSLALWAIQNSFEFTSCELIELDPDNELNLAGIWAENGKDFSVKDIIEFGNPSYKGISLLEYQIKNYGVSFSRKDVDVLEKEYGTIYYEGQSLREYLEPKWQDEEFAQKEIDKLRNNRLNSIENDEIIVL